MFAFKRYMLLCHITQEHSEIVTRSQLNHRPVVE